MRHRVVLRRICFHQTWLIIYLPSEYYFENWDDNNFKKNIPEMQSIPQKNCLTI